jgi:hypothetical protein
VGFPSHLRSLRATMSQKSSLPQAAKSVSQVLMSDRQQPQGCRVLTARLRSAGWPFADLSPDQLDPVIQVVEAEMVDDCLECHASVRLL